jgi:hypothetical protein
MLWPSLSAAGFLVAIALVVALARSETVRWERGRRAEQAARRRPRHRRTGPDPAAGPAGGGATGDAAAPDGPVPGGPPAAGAGVRDEVRRPDRPRRPGRPGRRLRQAAAGVHPVERALHLPGRRRRGRSQTPAP